jgi:hypothetical protein
MSKDDATEPEEPEGAGWHAAGLVFFGSLGIFLNAWHAMHAHGDSRVIGLIVGIVPPAIAAYMSHDVAKGRDVGKAAVLVYAVCALGMALSINAQAQTVEPYTGKYVCLAFPIMIDLATFYSLNRVTAATKAKAERRARAERERAQARAKEVAERRARAAAERAQARAEADAQRAQAERIQAEAEAEARRVQAEAQRAQAEAQRAAELRAQTEAEQVKAQADAERARAEAEAQRAQAEAEQAAERRARVEAQRAQAEAQAEAQRRAREEDERRAQAKAERAQRRAQAEAERAQGGPEVDAQAGPKAGPKAGPGIGQAEWQARIWKALDADPDLELSPSTVGAALKVDQNIRASGAFKRAVRTVRTEREARGGLRVVVGE